MGQELLRPNFRHLREGERELVHPRLELRASYDEFEKEKTKGRKRKKKENQIC